MMDIRILLVDPLPLIRRGLAIILSAEPGFVIVGEAEDASQAVAKARRLRPEIILCEFELPGGDATHICATVASEGLATRVLILSTDCQGHVVSQAVSAGVAGYLSKHDPTERIVSAIRRVAAGQPVFSDEAQTGIQLYLQLQMRSPEASRYDLSSRPLLTDRELQVLRCIADGVSVADTGRRLAASLSTIKNHRQSIFVKLNVPNAPAAVYEAMHRGLIQ